MVLYINGAAVVSWGTRFRMRAGVDASAFERQRYLRASLTGSLPQWHILCPSIDANQRVDASTVQQLVSREVIMDRVEADVFLGEAEGMPPEVVNGVKETLAVVSPRLRELHRYREFDL